MNEWMLDPEVDHLNHGSFGACPRPVLEAQQRWRDQLEANPVRFMLETYQPALDRARSELADFVAADPEGLVFVPNATTGVNAVLRSLEPDLGPGDEIVISDHAYNACRNAAEVTAMLTGARLVVASIPLPIVSKEQVTEAVLDRVTERTRLVIIDHVTSPTALVFPVEQIIARLEPDIPVLVDGAHAPGMIPLDLGKLGASFVVGNCHKWLCAPKGAGYLSVREEHRDRMRPVTISHGWNEGLSASISRFHALFDWTGTDDPTARLSVPTAIETIGNSHPSGWPGVIDANRGLALEARSVLIESLGVDPPAPDDMIGAMVSLPLADTGTASQGIFDPLTERLRHHHRIEVPVFAWPASHPQGWIRISAQRYNSISQYRRLADVLAFELGLRSAGQSS